MDSIEEDVIAFDDYVGEDQDFDQIDDLQVENVSDPEESWGDEEPSEDSDYSLISDPDVRCGWIDTSLPVMKKSDSNESEWEVVSVGSVISLSDCTVNSIAREILEREQDLSGFTEPVMDVKADEQPEIALTSEKQSPEKKKTVKKHKKYRRNVKFGIVLFRNNGFEMALCKRPGAANYKSPMILPHSSMKKNESPLDAAVRCFVESTGCTNFDRFAALPNLISKETGKKTYLFFPTVVNCKLQFLPGMKYSVEWLPTATVARAGRNKTIDENIRQVVNEAAALLEANAHSIPVLVDPEVEELADMAHRDLLDFALSQNVSVTSSEVRNFLARNEEDLQKMFDDPSKEELQKMMRKMIMQLPAMHEVKKNDSNLDDPVVNLGHVSDQALQLLATFVAAHTQADGSVKWKRVNEMLHEHIEVMVDPKVQQVLQTCGWSAEKQKFTKNKKIRLGLFHSAIATHRSSTSI